MLAGALVAFGSLFSTIVSAGAEGVLPYGLIRLLGGLVFSLGLILVIVGGAELFTGNNLVVMACASGKVHVGEVLGAWGIVNVGNFVGGVGIALLGQMVEVISGLIAGDRVVLHPSDRVKEGAAVSQRETR